MSHCGSGLSQMVLFVVAVARVTSGRGTRELWHRQSVAGCSMDCASGPAATAAFARFDEPLWSLYSASDKWPHHIHVSLGTSHKHWLNCDRCYLMEMSLYLLNSSGYLNKRDQEMYFCFKAEAGIKKDYVMRTTWCSGFERGHYKQPSADKLKSKLERDKEITLLSHSLGWMGSVHTPNCGSTVIILFLQASTTISEAAEICVTKPESIIG